MSQVAAGPDCLNCGAALEGPFCQSCGQKASSARLGVHDVLHEAAHGFLHLDGKIITLLYLAVLFVALAGVLMIAVGAARS